MEDERRIEGRRGRLYRKLSLKINSLCVTVSYTFSIELTCVNSMIGNMLLLPTLGFIEFSHLKDQADLWTDAFTEDNSPTHFE